MALLRILVILLLLANIAWFGWTQWRVEPIRAPEETSQPIPPPADAPALELLSERPAPARACFTLGPFRDPAEADRVETRIADYAQRQQIRETQATEDRGWWVYLKASGNRSLANQNLRALKQAGFDEAYLINSGEFENVISLGLFSNEANARILHEEVSAAGFSPVLGGRTETISHYWVDYEPDGGVDAPWQIITRRSAQVGHHAIACFQAPPVIGLPEAIDAEPDAVDTEMETPAETNGPDLPTSAPPDSLNEATSGETDVNPLPAEPDEPGLSEPDSQPGPESAAEPNQSTESSADNSPARLNPTASL